MSAYRKPAEVKPLEIITEKKPMDQNELYLRGHRTWGSVVALLIVCIFVTVNYAYYIEPATIRVKTELANAEREVAERKLAVAREEANAEMHHSMVERAYTDRIMFETLARLKETK